MVSWLVEATEVLFWIHLEGITNLWGVLERASQVWSLVFGSKKAGVCMAFSTDVEKLQLIGTRWAQQYGTC